MEIEDILKALDHHTITINRVCAEEGHRFERNISFVVSDKNYRIEWWTNISYLFHGDLQIPFKTITRSNHWPNGAKTNLQFYTERGNVACILKIEN